ncbi:MAG: hypothetical protein AVDCRST_MAG68-4254, partial [uncultured Gemmatimonadetes bacterium]
ATPAPPTYSSPATPTGTGHPPASSTYTRVFATGRPIGTPPRPSSTASTRPLTAVAASEGPYRLWSSTRGSRSRKRRATAPGSASPPHSTRRSATHPPIPGCSSSTCSIDGTRFTVPIRSRRITATSASGSRCPSGPAITTRAPASSGRNTSRTEPSKLSDVLHSTASSAPIFHAASPHDSRFTRLPWVFITPLGRPVEPEV